MAFYRCPNNERVILGEDHDDKVICRCGKPNPKAPRNLHRTEVVEKGFSVHYAVYMPRATEGQYRNQAEWDRAGELRRLGWRLLTTIL